MINEGAALRTACARSVAEGGRGASQCNRGFFARLTKQRLKRGVFRSLVSAINRFVAEANTEPKPFHWAKDPDTIIAAVRCGHQVLDYSG